MTIWTQDQMASIHRMLNPKSFAIVGATPRQQYGGRMLNAALKMPEVKSHYDRMHLTTMGGTPERMAEIVKADTRRWGEVIRTANVNID